MTRISKFVSLNSYVPNGPVEAEDFSVTVGEVPDLAAGQVLIRPIVFSVDPTLRGRLTGVDNYYAPQVRLGAPIDGWAVGEVVESRLETVHPGDRVTASMEWAELTIWPPADHWLHDTLQHVDPELEKPSYALGVLGQNGGVTAYAGMVEAGQIQAGETVVVSAAAGNVGSLAGQIAKLRGATVIGLAGTDTKRRVLTERLGFDAALDYHAPDLDDQILAHAPTGPDLYFDNVGGQVSQTVMWTMKQPARVVVCGQIATYDDAHTAWTINIKPIFANGLTLRGFTPLHYAEEFPTITRQLNTWLKASQLTPLETEHIGLASLPAAFSGLLRGDNLGKTIVTLGT